MDDVNVVMSDADVVVVESLRQKEVIDAAIQVTQFDWGRSVSEEYHNLRIRAISRLRAAIVFEANVGETK